MFRLTVPLRGHRISAAVLSGLAVLAPVWAPASDEDAATGESYLIELDLAAHRSGASGRGELLAGARLSMRARRAADGALTLGFDRALEDPWKLFHVDPLGPFGRLTQVATVITLPEASWEVLDARRAESAQSAVERHARWRPAARRKPPLDGSFAFVVIGPPEDRFIVEVAADGGVRKVVNRLTDRWLSGDFDRFVGGWGPDGERPGSPRGYWFWNHGETEPFRWQPRTYRAVAAALELLAREPRDGSEFLRGAERVVATLAPDAPNLAGRVARESPSLPIERHEVTEPGGETIVIATAKADRDAVTRRTVFAGGVVVADRLEVKIERRRGSLDLRIGYRPFDPDG